MALPSLTAISPLSPGPQPQLRAEQRQVELGRGRLPRRPGRAGAARRAAGPAAGAAGSPTVTSAASSNGWPTPSVICAVTKCRPPGVPGRARTARSQPAWPRGPGRSAAARPAPATSARPALEPHRPGGGLGAAGHGQPQLGGRAVRAPPSGPASAIRPGDRCTATGRFPAGAGPLPCSQYRVNTGWAGLGGPPRPGAGRAGSSRSAAGREHHGHGARGRHLGRGGAVAHRQRRAVVLLERAAEAGRGHAGEQASPRAGRRRLPGMSRSRTVTPSRGRGWAAAGDSGLPRGFSADTRAACGSTAARLAVAGSGPSCSAVSQASRSWL